MGCCFSTGAEATSAMAKVQPAENQPIVRNNSFDLHMAYRPEVPKRACGICMDDFYSADEPATAATQHCAGVHADMYHPSCLRQHITVKLEELQVGALLLRLSGTYLKPDYFIY